MAKKISIALFCGGRGGSAIIFELLRHSFVDLKLIVNAYDDGLSTGAIRHLIPGMLGPSDFRKNLSYLISPHLAEQHALKELLEYRFSKSLNKSDFSTFIDWCNSSSKKNDCALIKIESLDQIFSKLSHSLILEVKNYLKAFFDFYLKSGKNFDFNDCSLGNLVFAGAFLISNHDFNKASSELSDKFKSRAKLINVTNGENRILAALKEDGEFLTNEEKIVNKQSASKIKEIFLLPSLLTHEQLSELEKITTFEGKKSFLKSVEDPVYISQEAQEALLTSDMIIYSPGTQFSSLLPSYKTIGVKEAISKNTKALKVFVSNIHTDHDIESLVGFELLENALYHLGDSTNQNKLINQAFFNAPLVNNPKNIKLDDLLEYAKNLNIDLSIQNFENQSKPGTHSGFEVMSRLFEVYEKQTHNAVETAKLFVDLNTRIEATDLLIQEFSEIQWSKVFSHSELNVAGSVAKEILSNPFLTVKQTLQDTSEEEIFYNWLMKEESGYLITMTGDGEYRLRDAFSIVQFMKTSKFGIILGSRSQSRAQFRDSLLYAYGESRLFHLLSIIFSFIISALFAFRFKIILSDPHTGFRIYRRSHLLSLLPKLHQKPLSSSLDIIKLSVKQGVEIGELPVTYQTYKGFTNMRYRIKRGFNYLFSLVN
jgi:2-phospho-L-lactate transferase/gluconeogenesis factor (CofD/UPF0052 family)